MNVKTMMSLGMTVVLLSMTAMLTGCGGAGVEPTAQTIANASAPSGAEISRAVAENTLAGADMAKWIADIDAAKAIQREQDGTMSVKPVSRAVTISNEARQFAQQNIDVINTLVKQGKVTVDDQLLIHPVGESRSVWVQSWNWWGAQIAIDNGSTQQLINSLKGNNLSNAVNMFRSAVNGQMLNIVIALLKMAWGWTIEYVNNSGGQRGVYVNVTWTTFMWVTPR